MQSPVRFARRDTVVPSGEPDGAIGTPLVAFASLGADDDVVLLRWPEQHADAERLSRIGRPYLLLVEPGVEAPVLRECLADWIRMPADDADVRARLSSLSQRAQRHPAAPSVGEFGEFVYHGQRILLSPIEQRIAELLVASFERVVSDDALVAHVWSDSKGRSKLRVHISRLRKRVAPLGLEIAVIRDVGYRLGGVNPTGDARGALAASS